MAGASKARSIPAQLYPKDPFEGRLFYTKLIYSMYAEFILTPNSLVYYLHK